VVLARLEEDAITGTDRLDPPAFALQRPSPSVIQIV
jgi:hypothetical protein